MTRQFLALLTAILVMAFSSLMLTRISDAEVDPKTALGVWLFEDGTGKKAMDSSGNDNHGELVKNPKWAKGKFGGALELNGRSSHVSVPHIPGWNFGKKDFTIALWINMKEKLQPGQKSTMVGHINQKAQEKGWRFQLEGQAEGRLWWEHGGKNTMGPQVDGGISIGEWHHYAITLRSNSLTMFFDGKAQNNQFWSDDLVATESPLTIGGRLALNGIIDEVAIFKAGMFSGDVKSLLNGLENLAFRAVSPSGKLATTWGYLKNRE